MYLTGRIRYDATGNRIVKRVDTPSSSTTTHYVRDASGNVMATYQETELLEQPVYGSARIGLYKGGSIKGHRMLGQKQYELSNHLGNVLAVITDNVGMNAGEVWATVVSTSDYYPFGMQMQGRTFQSESYRYGFQGQEKDDETGLVDYKFRMHDPRIGRFFAVDPLADKYPYYSPYQFSGNRLIDMIELEGLEPAQSGSYAGQGAIAPQVDECGEEICGTENSRWTWSNNRWNSATAGVTSSELTTIFPNGRTSSLRTLETSINLDGPTFGLTSRTRIAHFISQSGHEVGGFSEGLGIEENLNYSVSGLTATFGKYFYSGIAVKGKYNADDYGRKKGQVANKEGIANIVYASRMGNGDFASGDGYTFRGRGIFQLTGRDNYSSFNNFMNTNFPGSSNFLNSPALLTEDKYSIMSAMWYFQSRVLNKLDINSSTVKQVTYKVNGGYNGLSDRQSIYDKAIETIK
jgi:RHS repeat-associated protein